MFIPALHTISKNTSESLAVQELLSALPSEQDRFHLSVALASLEEGSSLFEGLEVQQLRERRSWALLTRFSAKWREENGALPTFTSWTRVERLSVSLFGEEEKDRLDCIDTGYLKDPSQQLANFVGQRRADERGDTQSWHAPTIERCMEEIRSLLEIRNGYLSLETLQCELVSPRLGPQDRHLMSAVALGVYSNDAPEKQRSQLSRALGGRDSNTRWEAPSTLSMAVAQLVGDALLAQHKKDPELLHTTLDEIFGNRANLESFFTEHLPFLPASSRQEILNHFDSTLFYEYLPQILSIMFVSLGSVQERNALVGKFFAWAEQNPQTCPLAIYWLAHALTSSRTGLTEKWLPKCFSLFDEGLAPCPTPKSAWEQFALSQESFAGYRNPFPWLQREKQDLPAPLLTALLRADYPEEKLQNLLEWVTTNNQPLLSYRVLDEVLRNEFYEQANFCLSRQLAESLFGLVDPLSLTTSRFRKFHFSLHSRREAVIYCLLVKKMAEHPRLQADEYVNARKAINEVLPRVNAKIADMQDVWDEKVRALLPKKAIQPLPTPSGLRRIFSWLRYTAWPTTKLTAKVFAKVITYLPRLAWDRLCKGRFKDRVVTVGCSAAVAALFIYCFAICTIVTLLWGAYFSRKIVCAIQEGEVELKDVAKV